MKKKTLLIICLLPVFSFLGLENAVLFSGNSNGELADSVARHLGIELGDISVSTFNDQEIRIRINENIRNRDSINLYSQ